MKSLSEIEAAVDLLSHPEQVRLLQHLQERIEPVSYESIRDLFEEPGRLGSSGIGDLSSNKKHLEGYGRPERRVKC
jgi:hypothetical protein